MREYTILEQAYKNVRLENLIVKWRQSGLLEGLNHNLASLYNNQLSWHIDE
jgi:hypothetical protein